MRLISCVTRVKTFVLDNELNVDLNTEDDVISLYAVQYAVNRTRREAATDGGCWSMLLQDLDDEDRLATRKLPIITLLID